MADGASRVASSNTGELTMPLRIGHRGAAGYERENTLDSFRRAIDLGVNYIETDLRLTADGVIILNHDPWIKGDDGHRKEVKSSTLAELPGGLDVIATLADVLDVARGRTGLMLEIKVEGIASRTIEQVERAGFDGPLIYASFHHSELLVFRELRPRAQTLALLHAGPVNPTQFAEDARATHAGLNVEFATEERVAALHRAGFQVFVYSVDEPSDIAAMKMVGVDGIISDYPDRL
jgi:glycerophosphoryl diester phosphodiesterase